MIIITVKPSRRDNGRGSCPYRDCQEIPVRGGAQAHSTRGQLFDGQVGERLIVSRSTQPLLDACRVLTGEGVDPSMRVVMHYAGQDRDALRSTIGAAAKLTVTTVRGKTVFAKWQPWKAGQTHLEAPPIRQNEEAGV